MECSRRRARRRAALLAAAVAIGSPVGQSASAADPQSYTVTIKPTGDSALDAALGGSSSLSTLRKSAPVGPFALVMRAEDDKQRLATALHSFGYYDGQASVTIAGRALDDPALPELLQNTRAGTPVPVEITIDKGPLFHLRRLDLQGDVPAAARAELQLKPGDPARAADVLAVKPRLLDALREAGHALAKVGDPVATELPAAHAIDVSWAVEPGPRVDIGEISIKGLKAVNESFVRRRLLVHTGQLYQPSKIEAARQDLNATGVFASVRAQDAGALDPLGRMPIEFDVTERKRHVVGITGAFSTDEGASVALTWSHRNLFGNAEQLNLRAAVTNLGGTDTRSPGYDLDAQLVKPDFLARDQSLALNLEALKQSLDAYDQTAVLASATLNRRISTHWSGSLGIQAEQEEITQEDVVRDYTLLSLPLAARFDSTNDLFEPTRGFRLSVSATPTQSLTGQTSTFVILQGTASTYLDFSGGGRSVLALRGTLGSVQGASTFQLPPDQRLYAGGSGTVRGYRYQYVGPHFPDNLPVGGTGLAAGTVEFRQRIWGNIGAAVFTDAGEVTSTSSPFGGKLAIGSGIGARYFTPIGPVRVDVAVPLVRFPGSDSFELYIGIGEAF